MERKLAILITVGIFSATVNPTFAQTFSSKTVKLIVPYAPGGSYDVYARVVAEHLRLHLPDVKSIVVQNMPGAGGMTAVQNLYSREAPDGTSIAIMPRDVATNQILRPEIAKYDARKFSWVGSVAAYAGVLYVAANTNVRSVDDLKKREIIIGAWGQGTESFTTPTILNAVVGTKFKIVSGYAGGPEVDLAVERGEAEGRVASWTFLKTQRPDWLTSKFITTPFQTGLKRHPELPNIPLITELAQDEAGKQILNIMNADSGIGWSFAAPPGMSVEMLGLFRMAFDKTMADKEFMSDADKRGLEILPSTGAEIQNLVNVTLSTPPSVITKLRALLGAAK